MIITPTIGRVVWFFSASPNGIADIKKQAHPALVCFVHNDRCVNLAVFDEQGNPYARTSVPLFQEGDLPAQGDFCCWMPYQLSQAAVHAPGGAKVAPAGLK